MSLVSDRLFEIRRAAMPESSRADFANLILTVNSTDRRIVYSPYKT